MTKQEFYLIGLMAIVTFLIRYSLLAFSSRIKLPPRLMEALEYLPPAILTAIIVPEILITGDEILLNYTNARLVGAIAAVLISWYTKNLLTTIVGGMLTFVIWQRFLGNV